MRHKRKPLIVLHNSLCHAAVPPAGGLLEFLLHFLPAID